MVMEQIYDDMGQGLPYEDAISACA